jgi:hypothetical protein
MGHRSVIIAMWEDKGRRISVSGQPGAKTQDLIQKTTKAKKE